MESEIPGSSLRKGFLYGAIFFSAAGGGLALYASDLTFRLTVSGIIDPSGCSFNDWLSCDTVLSTNSAKMFGVPSAWWGFIFYLWTFFTLLFALFNSKKTFGKACTEAVLFISFISILITLFKIYQLITIGVICPVCVGMYIANFGIFLFALIALRLSLKEAGSFEFNYLKNIFTKSREEQSSPHPLRFGIIFLWLFIMGYLGIKYYENTVVVLSPSKTKLIINEHFMQVPLKINVDGAPVTGNPEAKIKVVEFSDFECPACKLLSENMKTILLEYNKDLSFYFMNFPLDSLINENIKKQLHKNAGVAAIAGICAHEQGDFWNYQNELFENHTKLGKDFLIELSVKQGLNKEKFISCLESDSTKQKVIDNIKTAHEIGVTSTPSLFINGRKVKYWNSPVILNAIIEEELKRQK